MNKLLLILHLKWCLAAFLAGSIPFGLILVRLAGKGDVRAQGSGNIGATNVARAGGKGLGILTLFLDALKGFLPVFIAAKVGYQPEFLSWVALAAVAGHMYTPWLKFEGGKGVATALGAVAAFHAPMLVPAFGTFLALFLIFRYVSLGSVAAAVVLFLTVLGAFGRWAAPELHQAQGPVLAWAILAGLVIRKHAANINRLVNGTESKFWGAKKDA